MARLIGVADSGLLAFIVRGGSIFFTRPLVKDRKETSDVLDELPGVLAAEFTPVERLPQANSLSN
jgi:hypothetical protein